METLLAIITIVQRAGGKRLLLGLFSRLMAVLGLVITTAVIISAMIAYGLINAHIALLASGMSWPLALLFLGSVTLLIIAALIGVIAWQLQRLRHPPRSSPLIDTLDAFTHGLMAD